MTRDGHIRLLPLHVANKIAAGEVVERPASVLKELLENALDAGATRIEATVLAGGRTLVAVRDNGCGMTREDALLSLERQATSKIRDVDDIERIDTLGFRGEAIPSIASVSRFTLTTRRAEDEGGTCLAVNAGLLAEVRDCGAPPGTCVEVRDLFCNVPARRKFLRAVATEETHIRATFTLNALAHPDVGFTLVLDGREAYRLPPGATLEERIRDLFGTPFAESLLPFGDKPEGASAVYVHGYVERPERGLAATPATRRDQFVFVNGRPATAAAVAYALREAYPRTREEARPALVLFIDLPPGQVDVNVHPAKREVRFRRPSDVRDAIISSIRRVLAPAPVPAPTAEMPAAASIAPFSTPVQPSFAFPPSAPRPAPAPTPPDPLSRPRALWRWFHVLAQTSTGYVLLETDTGLVTLDPRAARARIAYERLLDRQAVASQPLLIPETVQLPPADSARIRNFQKDLEAVGFVLEAFGRDTWKIDAVPDLVGGVATANLLASIAADIAALGARRGSARWRDELVAKSLAQSLAGASPKLTAESAERLVEELAGTKMPYICPRGKPVMVFRSHRELSRNFGR